MANQMASMNVAPDYSYDGQPFAINSTQIVTLLTLAAISGTGQTILNSITSLAIGIGWKWVYSAPTNTWMPS